MNYRQFASDLPPGQTVVFHSVEENEETMRAFGVTQELRQLGAGTFRCDMAVRSMPQAEIFVDRFSKAVTICLEPPAGSVGLLVPRSASGRFRCSGENVANDKMVIMPDGCGTDIVVPDLSGSEAVSIPRTRFKEMAEVLCPTSVAPERTAVVEGDVGGLHRLRNAMLELISYPALPADEEEVENLLAAMVTWVGSSSDAGNARHITTTRSRSRIAKLAREFIEEHYREVVRIEHICRFTGVGVRTLQRCFREYFDLTISDYLKAVRLDSARRELVVADGAEDKVSTIAVHNGLTNLGRFSVEFRKRFGESPRETLATRRSR
jgi:AraC-like DNA-binding protein